MKMKNYGLIFILLIDIVGLGLPLPGHADIFHVIGDLLKSQLNQMEQQSNLQQELLHTNQLSIQQLQQQVAALTGNRGYGNVGFDNQLQSWGEHTQNWQDILHLYQNNSINDGLNEIVNQLHQQNPIESNIFKNAVPNDPNIDNQYTQQAQTLLATRAASEFTFNQITKQIEYQQQLQKQIDHTANVKDALDLQNRLQVENNLLQLQLLRLMAMSTQQQALQAQSMTDSVVSSAKFLTQ